MKKQSLDILFRSFIVVATSTVYCLGLIWFLEPAGIYAAGITGFSQVIKGICDHFFNIPLGVYNAIFNVPLFIYGWKRVSKSFALYSLLSVGVQSLLMLDFIPMIDFGINNSTSLDPLACAMIGGVILGFACALALRYGTSTGGIDMVAQALAINKGVSIGTFTMIFNVSTAIVGGAIISKSWPIALYSCVRIIINSIIIDKIHTSYNHVKLNIISSNVNNGMLDELLAMHRGCTMVPVEGAYSHQKKFDLIMVVNVYEIDKAISICKKYDPKAFIIVEPVKRLYGNYTRKSIV